MKRYSIPALVAGLLLGSSALAAQYQNHGWAVAEADQHHHGSQSGNPQGNPQGNPNGNPNGKNYKSQTGGSSGTGGGAWSNQGHGTGNPNAGNPNSGMQMQMRTWHGPSGFNQNQGSGNPNAGNPNSGAPKQMRTWHGTNPFAQGQGAGNPNAGNPNSGKQFRDEERRGNWFNQGGGNNYANGYYRHDQRGFGMRPENWNNRPRNFDRRFYEHNFHAENRFHYGYYRRPYGWYYRRWSYGEYLPQIFWSQDYWLTDWWLFDLPIPPYGYEWVRYGDDALLINIYTGQILEVEYGVFY